jgi:glutathione S-transferase
MSRLFFTPRTRSDRVLWAPNEIGAAFESTLLASEERRSPEHRARHPLGRLPAFELDDGTMVFESAAICTQRGDLYPDSGLLPPPGSSARALVYQWVMFGMTDLESSLYRWIGDMPDGATDSPTSERFAEAAEAIASALDETTCLLGDRFTFADIVCVGVLGSAASRGLIEPWPVVRDYVERGEGRPAYAAAVTHAVWGGARATSVLVLDRAASPTETNSTTASASPPPNSPRSSSTSRGTHFGRRRLDAH